MKRDVDPDAKVQVVLSFEKAHINAKGSDFCIVQVQAMLIPTGRCIRR